MFYQAEAGPEIYYLDTSSRWWLVQGPSLGDGVVAEAVADPELKGLCDYQESHTWTSHADMDVLSEALDARSTHESLKAEFMCESLRSGKFSFLTPDLVRARLGEHVYLDAKTYQKGEAEYVWAREVRLTKL